MVKHLPEKYPRNTPFPVLPPFTSFRLKPTKNGSSQRLCLVPPFYGRDPLGVQGVLRGFFIYGGFVMCVIRRGKTIRIVYY